MRIAFVTHGNCIRVSKMAIGLINAGHEVHLITKEKKQDDFYKTVATYLTVEQLRNEVELYSNVVDVFHYHNEPNYPFHEMKRAAPDKKMVLDMHDSDYWMMIGKTKNADSGEKISYYNEDVAMELADGIIVPSMYCYDDMTKRTETPVMFMPSACPQSWFHIGGRGHRGGLVSMGAHTVGASRPGGEWRDYADLYESLKGLCQVHIYSPNLKPGARETEYYQNLIGDKGIIGCFPLNEMIQRMGEHTWSLVGNSKGAVLDVNLPNKFWDSMAAGVPIVNFNCKAVDWYIEKYDIGISVKTPAELMARWDEHISKRLNVLKFREKFCMENYIPQLVHLYNKILKPKTEKKLSKQSKRKII